MQSETTMAPNRPCRPRSTGELPRRPPMFSSSRTPPAVEPDGKAFAILCSIGIGAALMYFLDPDSGRRRRALTVEKSARLKRSALEKQDAMVRDVLHRVSGALAGI